MKSNFQFLALEETKLAPYAHTPLQTCWERTDLLALVCGV